MRASSIDCSGALDPAGDNGDGIIGLSLVFCKYAAIGLLYWLLLLLLVRDRLFSEGLPNELGVRPPDDTRFKFGREEEVGPLMVLAPSPNPTRLAFPSSLILLTLDAASSGSSLILSPSNASLPLAQVVRPPTLPVALALPTVLRSLAFSKYPEVACAAGREEPPI